MLGRQEVAGCYPLLGSGVSSKSFPVIFVLIFLQYKYQLNIDGTVAAYRLPYLLAGDSLVIKQDSPYYEHFYSQLEPWVHYVPMSRDLGDVEERVQWARDHDGEVSRVCAAGVWVCNYAGSWALVGGMCATCVCSFVTSKWLCRPSFRKCKAFS